MIAYQIVPFDFKYHLKFVDYSCTCGCRGTQEGFIIQSCPGCGSPMMFRGQIGSMYKFVSEEVLSCIPRI